MGSFDRRSGLVLPALAALTAAALLVAPVSAYAERKIGLSSGTFKFELASGEGEGGTVFLSNDGDEPVSVMVYAADQQVDEKGNLDYVAPTRADITQLDRPSAWIGLKMPRESKAIGNIPYVELEPGQRIPVEFMIDVPQNAAPGDHNIILFFEMFDQGARSEGAQTIISGRLGARVTVRVDGVVVERLSMRPFEVPSFVIGSKVPFSLLVNNEGNVDQRVTVNAELRDRSGNALTTVNPVDARLVFASRGLEASGAVLAESSAIGPMTLAAEVIPVDDDGNPLAAGRDIISEQRTVWLVPMWAVIAAGAVLILLLARVLAPLVKRSAGGASQQAGDASADAGSETGGVMEAAESGSSEPEGADEIAS